MPTNVLQISDLPAAPAGRTGWPWTEAPPPDPAVTLPAGAAWPRLSIVTPLYNQAQYVEETIRSVLLQGYPNLEYIVIDDGSTDQGLEIIKKYAPWLTAWRTGPNQGQTQTINAGWRLATGDILAWLNSDDTYLPGTLHKVAAALQADADLQLVYGSVNFVHADGAPAGFYQGQPLRAGVARMAYWRGWPIPQPGFFFKTPLIKQFGYLDESFQYAMDYEWLIRVSKRATFKCLPLTLANYRLHPSSKSGGLGDWNTKKKVFYRECERANRKHAPLSSPSSWPLWLARLRYQLKSAVVREA